ncbi:MAG TPA: potassium-transporting ATPase subunit C [Candidatus Acidoferrales bacterium]|nr:potassium-transporting ATPase subunit C [Candidatus Acidoferrales bacterium]
MEKDLVVPIFTLALVSMLLCGLAFPLVLTGIAQIALPYQANGEIVQFHGRGSGSWLISENFSSPMFFHAYNASASGVDPDATLQDAYSQIPRIHNATGIPTDALKKIVDNNVEWTLFVTGNPYVNVLKLNLILIQQYPSVYSSFS